MTEQIKIGGVNRRALLRLWFLFFAWACVGGLFAPYQPWRWLAWSLGSALTFVLLHRRNDLAGIVGYVVAATATAMTLPAAFSLVGAFLSGRVVDYDGSHFSARLLLFVSRDAALAFVPTLILAFHVASRHRLQRSFEESVALRRHGRIIPPGAYYFVTLR